MTSIGTHDVISIVVTESNRVIIRTGYFEQSTALGALYVFVFITEDGGVDFTRSSLLILDKNTSLYYTLPCGYNLSPGRYEVFVHDIEHEGTLTSGVSYPAVTTDLPMNGRGQGMIMSSTSEGASTY